MANRFILNETSYHGSGAIKDIATEAKGRAFKKPLVCSDPDLIKFNVTKKVTDILDNAGIAYEIYSNIKPNPTSFPPLWTNACSTSASWWSPAATPAAPAMNTRTM